MMMAICSGILLISKFVAIILLYYMFYILP